MSTPSKRPDQHPWVLIGPLLVGTSMVVGILAVIVGLVAIWAGPGTQDQWANTAALLTLITVLTGGAAYLTWAHWDGRW